MDEKQVFASRWEVARDPSYDRDIEALKDQVPRMDEVENSLDEALNRDPFAASRRLPESDDWVRLTKAQHDAPQLRIVFRVDLEHEGTNGRLIVLRRAELRQN